MSDFYDNLGISSPVGVVIISIAIMLFFGFLMTRITKLLKLPAVTAYIITGILIGPYCLNLIPSAIEEGMGFLSDITLAFIAFSTGEYFKLSLLKQNGIKVIIITVFEALLSALLVFLVTFLLLRLPLSLCILLCALSATTSPTSIMTIIRQTRAKGDFVNTLMPIIALDVIVGLMMYSVGVSLASAIETGNISVGSVLLPLAVNIGVMIVGGVFGLLLKLLIPQKRSTDNRLIILLSLLFAFCGICTLLDVSPLLGCLSMATVYANLTGEDNKLFKQLNYFSPPFLLLFFVKSGVGFDLGSLFASFENIAIPIALISVIYLIVRIIGKYVGAYLGCAIAKKDKSVKNNLGLALFSQAGVSIALASMGARILGGETGELLQAIIVSAGILYELIGPVCAKLALYLSGATSPSLEQLVPVVPLNPDGTQMSEINILAERIKAIRETNPPLPVEENENAFIEGEEEQFMHAPLPSRWRRFGRR